MAQASVFLQGLALSGYTTRTFFFIAFLGWHHFNHVATLHILLLIHLRDLLELLSPPNFLHSISLGFLVLC